MKLYNFLQNSIENRQKNDTRQETFVFSQNKHLIHQMFILFFLPFISIFLMFFETVSQLKNSRPLGFSTLRSTIFILLLYHPIYLRSHIHNPAGLLDLGNLFLSYNPARIPLYY